VDSAPCPSVSPHKPDPGLPTDLAGLGVLIGFSFFSDENSPLLTLNVNNQIKPVIAKARQPSKDDPPPFPRRLVYPVKQKCPSHRPPLAIAVAPNFLIQFESLLQLLPGCFLQGFPHDLWPEHRSQVFTSRPHFSQPLGFPETSFGQAVPALSSLFFLVLFLSPPPWFLEADYSLTQWHFSNMMPPRFFVVFSSLR